MTPIVIKTDGDFASTNIERTVLARVGANLVELQHPSEKELLAIARDADALMVLAYPVTRALLQELPRLRILARYGVGLDTVDVQAATDLGIPVAYVPDYCVDEVSSHAVALLLAVWRKLTLFGNMATGGTFEAIDAARPIHRLTGATVGLVGFGILGQAVARKLAGFSFDISATDPNVPDPTFAELGIRKVSLQELLRTADIISIHSSLTPATYHLIGDAEFASMKSGAILINTARGAIVDQVHLVRALQEGHLAGAGLDVLDDAAPGTEQALLSMANVLITPHVGAYSEEALADLQYRTALAVSDALSNHTPDRLANPEVWDHRRCL